MSRIQNINKRIRVLKTYLETGLINIQKRLPDSWSKRKSIIINAIALDFIVLGFYHFFAKVYGWYAGSYTLSILSFIIGIPLLIKGIKLKKYEFKIGGWDIENVYMLTRAYEQRLKDLGLDDFKWKSKLSQNYVWQCADREKKFRKLESMGKLDEVVKILKDDKRMISDFIKDLKGDKIEATKGIFTEF